MTPTQGPARYRVGCAGMFMMGMDYPMNDLDAALVSAQDPPGSFVYDVDTGECLGPFCQEEIDGARERLAETRA